MTDRSFRLWGLKPDLLILILGCVFFLPFLGSVHLFDWDEINFAESAREMLLTGDFFRVQVDFQPFWEKPPLFIWLQAFSMAVFGVNEFAARLPNALTGLATLWVFFRIGTRLCDERFGLMWSLLYLASLLPFLYFKSGIIDPLFNLFIFLGIYRLWILSQTPTVLNGVWSGLFIGLAVLTKGPVGLLLSGLAMVVFWFFRKPALRPLLKPLLAALVVFSGVTFLWYGVELIRHGHWFLTEFVRYQIRLLTTPDAGHQQPVYYHFLVVLIGCLPMSVLAWPSFRRQKESDSDGFQLLMLILFWVVMIVFTFVKTKIAHYSSLAYLPLSFLAAQTVFLSVKTGTFSKWLLWTVVGFCLIPAAVFIGLPLILMEKTWISGLITDPTGQSVLALPVTWNGLEWIPGAAFLLAVTVGTFWLSRRVSFRRMVIYLLIFPLSWFAILPVLSDRIEQYSQRSLIDFYQSAGKMGILAAPIGFKSYAHLFYTGKGPGRRPVFGDKSWMTDPQVPETVFLVTRLHRQHLVSGLPGTRLLYTRGGYAFFRRDP